MLRNKLNFKKRLEQAEQGQSLVEMAISFVVFVFLISGLIDFGRLYFTYVALEDSAGEGALYLSINPTCRFAADGAACADPNNAYWRIQNAGGTAAGSAIAPPTSGTPGVGLVNWNQPNIVIDPFVQGWPYPTVGTEVTVTIVYPFPLISPIVPPTAGINPLPLTVLATQTVIHCPIGGCPRAP